MRDFKFYKSRDALHEDFSTRKLLSGVIVKSPDCDENKYVCYEERNNSQFMFERVKFNDENVKLPNTYVRMYVWKPHR